MESSPNQHTQPMDARDKYGKLMDFLFDRVEKPFRPSAQIDADKTPEEARAVQLVIEGLQMYRD